MQFIYITASLLVSGTFPGAMCPTLCLDLKLHVTTSPSISLQCGDLSTELAIRLLIVLLYTKRIAVTLSYENSTTVHPQIQVSNK
jgi:hypothetical protein